MSPKAPSALWASWFPSLFGRYFVDLTSNSQSPLNNAQSRFASADKSFVSHSHTIATRHPNRSSSAWLRLSRAWLASSLRFQYSVLVAGRAAFSQPGC